MPGNVNPGLAARGGGADNASLPSGSGPVQGTLTLSDADGLLAPDDASVSLIRYDAAEQGKYDKIDMKLLTDPSGETITAGDTVTLYITSASATSADYPTTSEIVECGDKLIIRAVGGGFIGGASGKYDETGVFGTLWTIGGADGTFKEAKGFYEVTAPAPDPVTGAIKVPVKIYGPCSSDGGESWYIGLEVTEKGVSKIPGTTLVKTYQPFVTKTKMPDLNPVAESKVLITELAEGVSGSLRADPIVITSQFEVGVNSLLPPDWTYFDGLLYLPHYGVFTTDEYNNRYRPSIVGPKKEIQNPPTYGIGSEIGIATVDDTRAASVTYDEDDVGKTDTITVSVSGVGTKQLQIINIVKSLTATGLLCSREGPVVPLNSGEAIVQVRANGDTAVNRDIKITIDTDNSVADAELRDMEGVSMGTSSAMSLAAGSPDNYVLRLVVSAPEAGNVVVEASDATSGVTDLLDTCSTTIRFTELEKVPPTASISPADGSSVQPTASIVITVNDDYRVSLNNTVYSVEKDGSDITSSLACSKAGDGTQEGTITCVEPVAAAYSWGDMAAGSTTGLSDGYYVVTATPQDLMGNVGTEATSSFTVASCEPSVTISPATAGLAPGETQQFTASTSCDGSSPAGTYTWDIMTQGCTGSAIDSNGLYTTPATISGTSCNDTVRVTDTANGNVTDTASVTVGITTTTTTTPELTVSPDTVMRSRWVVIPTMMVLQSDTANFGALQSKVTYSPANAVIKMPKLVLGPHSIWQLVLVNPPWLAAGAEEGTLEVTVTTGTETVTGTTNIEMLPFGLDK